MWVVGDCSFGVHPSRLSQDDKEGKDDDGIPMLKPISCGRGSREPLIIRLPTLRDEANKMAELLSDAHREGSA